MSIDISFDLPKNKSNVIKVIGVGGGGSNAVNHMFNKGIKGVDFVVCNTDAQALQNSSVPNKIQLGASLTEGLGAGANPTVGEESAMESMEEIKGMLNTSAKMLFITVGMGGGTGTGAAPVIARIAKEMDILTVGIVTMPFSFEGKKRVEQAQIGIEKLRTHVDSLVVINNNKLREVYGNLGFKAGFSKADEVLSTAATGIAEVITHHYTQNIDLRDAKTVLSDSGTAIMGSGMASGPNRAQNAITKALDSPLLNDNKIEGAKNVLLLIVSGSSEVTIDEIGEINDYIQSEAKTNVDIIMGVGEDESLADSIAVTIIATGFNMDQQNVIAVTESKKIVHNLIDEKEAKVELQQNPTDKVEEFITRFSLEDEIEEVDEIDNVKDTEVVSEDLNSKIEEEYIITDVTPEPEIKENIENESEDQFSFTFDLPIQKEKVVTNISDVEIIGLEEIKPEPSSYDGKILHALEDDFSSEIKALKSVSNQENPNFEVRVEEKKKITVATDIVEDTEDISPMNLTIAELKNKADDRRRKMKEFNYKFIHKMNKNIDEIESQPAYKRMGVNLNDVPSSSEMDQSRMTLKVDEYDNIQLRSNNSFLHDNVD
ncbi:MAG: cell division protein FtsZ [Flavobacteriaceae bacterium]|nr:cell division protein FtsZ [Flavobacteriaceae bacterium]